MKWCFERQPLYQPLSSAELGQHGTTTRSARSLVIWTFSGILILLNLIAVFPIFYGKWIVGHQTPARPCGNSWQEAEAKGCQYNVMRHAWLAPACFDTELTNEFNSIAVWQFWADANRTRPLTIGEVSRRTGYIRASPEYLEASCAYSFRKLQRAIERGGDVEVGLSRLEEATQCQRFIMGRVPNPNGPGFESKENGEIWLNVMFPQCISMRQKWHY